MTCLLFYPLQQKRQSVSCVDPIRVLGQGVIVLEHSKMYSFEAAVEIRPSRRDLIESLACRQQARSNLANELTEL